MIESDYLDSTRNSYDTAAGLIEVAMLTRAPNELERGPQGYLLARK